MYQVEKALKDLVDVALKRGYVSFHQVNDYLPDEGGDPQMVDRLILVMEELELACPTIRQPPLFQRRMIRPAQTGPTRGKRAHCSPARSSGPKRPLFRRGIPSACT